MINQSQYQITKFTQYGIIIFFAIVIYYIFYKFDEFTNIFFRKYEHLSQLTNLTNSIQIGDTDFFSDGSISVGKNILIGSNGSFKIGPTLIDPTGKFSISNTTDQNLFPPVTNGLIALYDYTSVSADGFTLLDLVGNNHATVKTTRLQIINSIDISGENSTTVEFPTTILPLNYTLFTLAKYNTPQNTARLRIFSNTNSTTNWVSGFFKNNVGVAQRNTTWITPSTTPLNKINNLYNTTYVTHDSWILSTDQYNLYRANKIDLNNRVFSLVPIKIHLGINSVLYLGERSFFLFRCIIVYNRELTISEITSVEDWITTTYNL